MAGGPAKDPLDVLQAMFNEALVQTGKAIKASQKDGLRSDYSSGAALRMKNPETMKTYHYALDDLESEITRAKAVLLRDLGKLQEARAPVPAAIPSPVAPPAPMSPEPEPEPEPQRPAAVMMDMPSAAAHTVNTNANFQPIKEESKRAPFPDMGMGLSGDVPDSASKLKPPTASPRATPVTIKTEEASRATPPSKQSPKPAPPVKTTPVSTPQPVPPQPVTAGSAARRASVSKPQQTLASQAAQDDSLDAMLTLPPTGGVATADMTGGEMNFTNMQFSLAPASDELVQNAPPAPMQDFDLSSFTAQDAGGDLMSLDNLDAGGTSANPAPNGAPEAITNKASENDTSATNFDSMYDLSNVGNGNVEHMDLDLNLGGGEEAPDNTFDELFFEDNDTDMGQFNEAYFNVE